MRAREFVRETAVGHILTPRFEIVVDDHALERARERGVDPRAVDYIIRTQLPKVSRKLDRIEVNQKFWVYDWSRELALGLRRLSSTEPRFLLKTVWPGQPARTPESEQIISINESVGADEFNIEYSITQQGIEESANPADTLYFFDVAKGGRSFDHLDLRIMGLKKSQKGRWYYQPGRDSTDLLTTATLKYLEKTLNVPARAWTKPVAESRIIDPERVDVYYRPVPGSRGRRVVARNIPTRALEPLLQKLSKKYAVPVESFEWTPTEPMTEAFDQPYDIRWSKGDHGDYDAYAELDDGTGLEIAFLDQQHNSWMVDFFRDNSTEITGEGDAYRVLATVLTAIREFIVKQQPAKLNFSAEKNDDPTGSRASLYDRMIQRYITGTGYNLTRQNYPDGATYTLTRTQQDVAENFADGKGPGRPGDSQRHGIPKGATMAQLEKASHAKGRKGQLARWQLNMRRGRKK